MLSVFKLHHFLNAVYFDLANINFILILLQLHFCLLVSFFLSSSHSVKLDIHILNLLCLSMVNVGLASDVFVALLNLKLSRFVLLCHVSFRFFSFCKLNFDIA